MDGFFFFPFFDHDFDDSSKNTCVVEIRSIGTLGYYCYYILGIYF